MTIENLRIDTTTNSRVFNPLGAAGHWLCSKFKHRSIGDINMLYPTLVELTQDLPELKSITLYSEYGDAMEWNFIAPFVLVMTTQGVYTMINTYGMSNNKVLHLIKDCSVNVVFNIDGIHEQSGKVFLGSEWNSIKQNILTMGVKAHVKFYKLQHNAYQQPAIEQFCRAVGAVCEVVEDPLFGSTVFSIIDKQGKWLYDVHPAGSTQPTLHQTALGWNLLKTKVRKIVGKPIDEIEKIPVPFTATRLETDDFVNITIKGHVIRGSGIAQMFSYALCGDWHPTEIDINNSYNQTVMYELSKFAKKDLSTINIYNNNINDILEIV